jgi:predicted RNase H-like HicB family nuclease
MTETVFVVTPLRVRFIIEKDASGLYAGRLREYPGIVSQARTAEGVKRNLIRLLREISREHPEELRLFE